MIEIVVPVGQNSVIQLSNNPSETITFEQGTFKGNVRLSKELDQHLLMVTPDLDAIPTNISIISDGQQSETISIFPFTLNQENAFLYTQASIPDSESRDYTVYTEIKDHGSNYYNGTARESLRNIRISGRRLNIKHRGLQGILERLMPSGASAGDIKKVELYAQEVIIGAPLHIPGAELIIYAETLRFEDQSNMFGSIDTTPLQPAGPEITPGREGRTGQKGGNIYLQVWRIEWGNNDSRVRIIANGGTGQMGGPEIPGQKGDDKGVLPHEPQIGGIIRSWNDIYKAMEGNTTLPSDWQIYETPKNVVWFKRGNNFEWGNGTFPADGKQGSAGGRPGIGGSGGIIHSNTALPENRLSFSGGISGLKRPDAESGVPGNPTLSVGIRMEFFQVQTITYVIYYFNAHLGVKPPNVISPEAIQSAGDTGSNNIDLNRAWLTVNTAQAILAYSEDLYRMGFIIKTAADLEAFSHFLESQEIMVERPDAYITIMQRVNTLRTRISANLDYYGNPAGYVPSLNLAIIINLLQREVRASSLILAVSERVRMEAEHGQAAIERLSEIRAAASSNIISLNSQLDELSQSIPQLQVESFTVAQEEENLQLNTQQREIEIRNEAQALANPEPSFLLKSIKTIGTLAKVVPIYQPILGAVGSAIDFATSLDERTPWESITQIPSLANGFSKENFTNSLKNYKQTVENIKSMDSNNPQQFFSGLSSAANQIGKSMAEFKRIQDASRAPADKVDQMFQQLRTADTPYQNLLQTVSTLTARKRLLAEKIDGSIQILGEVTSQIATNTNRVDNLNIELSDAQNSIDHPSVIATKDIGRQVRERLDYYHYLLIKSFEYFTSQPYRGNRRAAGTADSLAQLLTSSSNDPNQAATAFEAVYTNEIRGTGRQIINMLNAQGQRNQKVVDLIMSVNELNKLNSSLNGAENTEDLFIDLEDRAIIPVIDLEARLLNIEVTECDCVITSGPTNSSSTLHIDFNVAPIGVIQSQSGRLSFRRSIESTVWGATIDLTVQPTRPVSNKLAEDVGQVLSRFLDQPGDSSVSYIASPPAYPGFKIRTRLETDADQPVIAEIRRLRMKLTYSSVTSSTVRAVRVSVTTPNMMIPFIYISRPDATGRIGGLPNFTRVYDTTEQIELIAPTNLGTSRFDGWYQAQNRVTTNNHLIVPQRSDSYRYEARYH